MTLSTAITALVFWSAKKCPSCLAGPLCWSGLSDLGKRFQSIRCHLPPCLSSYCPQRERTSEHMMFQSSRDKAWVHWKANMLLAHLILFWFHVPELSCAACFHFLCKAALIWTPAGSQVPAHILPLCWGGHMGSVQPVLGALSLTDGPASVHNMLCKPKAAGCVSSMFRVSQM